MDKKTAILRCQYLSEQTGLRVTSHNKGPNTCFQFDDGKQTVKSVFTYRKARCFAEGFRAGRSYERLLHKRRSLVSRLRAYFNRKVKNKDRRTS